MTRYWACRCITTNAEPVIPRQSARIKNGKLEFFARHARACRGHPRLECEGKSWDDRVIWRAGARSLSSGRAVLGPVGAFAGHKEWPHASWRKTAVTRSVNAFLTINRAKIAE